MKRTKDVHEVLELVSKTRSAKEKVKILQENATGALKDILRGSLDKSIVWLLPKGKPPYTPNKPESVPSNFIIQTKNLAYFVKGGPGEKLNPIKREKMFLNLLEAIHPQDAEHVVNMIAKKPPKGITLNVVKIAFPGLIVKE